jgi:hypothetical protein
MGERQYQTNVWYQARVIHDVILVQKLSPVMRPNRADLRLQLSGKVFAIAADKSA